MFFQLSLARMISEILSNTAYFLSSEIQYTHYLSKHASLDCLIILDLKSVHYIYLVSVLQYIDRFRQHVNLKSEWVTLWNTVSCVYLKIPFSNHA